MEYGALLGLMNLKKLILIKCKLNYMPNVYEKSKKAVKVLNLRNNDINYINESYFTGFTNLTHLYLDENLIKSVPIITPLTKLILFGIASNVLEDMSVLYTISLPHLKEIHLNNNNITSLSLKIIDNYPNLYAVDLQHNCISYIQPLDLPEKKPGKRPFLRLYGNPWDCGRPLQWWTRAQEYVRLDHIHWTCADPAHLHGRLVTSIGNIRCRPS